MNEKERKRNKNKAGYTARQSRMVGQEPLAIQKTLLPTYRPTDTARCRVACPRLKTNTNYKAGQL